MKKSLVAVAVVVGIIGVLLFFAHHLFGLDFPHRLLIASGIIVFAVILFIYGLVAKKAP